MPAAPATLAHGVDVVDTMVVPACVRLDAADRSALEDRLPLPADWAARWQQVDGDLEAFDVSCLPVRLAAMNAVRLHNGTDVDLPVLRTGATVTLRLGPTNSGKTHGALQRLIDAGEGCFAAPLRLLAREAYDRIGGTVGFDRVGLITGEESINPTAPIICATADAAPLHGSGVLVVDEAHWLTDEHRGHVWTRLIALSSWTRIELIAAGEAESLLRRMVAGAATSTVVRSRRSRLEMIGAVRPADVESGTVVVTFSRRSVLELQAEFQQLGRRAAGLYGAMTPDARHAVLDRFVAGDVDVLVATDVIGHGVNLPTSCVLMAETRKYDGTRTRDLDTWEAAQIVGRAGRDGVPGRAGVLARRPRRGGRPDAGIVREAVLAANGDRDSREPLREAKLAPVLADLDDRSALGLPATLARWEEQARAVYANHDWIVPTVPTDLAAMADLLVSTAERLLADGSTHDAEWLLGASVWAFVTLPIQSGGHVASVTAEALLGHTERLSATARKSVEVMYGRRKGDREAHANRLRELAVVATTFPTLLHKATVEVDVDSIAGPAMIEVGR